MTGGIPKETKRQATVVERREIVPDLLLFLSNRVGKEPFLFLCHTVQREKAWKLEARNLRIIPSGVHVTQTIRNYLGNYLKLALERFIWKKHYHIRTQPHIYVNESCF